MQHLRTCSDDEDFAVVGGYSESSADTDELLGNVDWSLQAGSDDYDAPGCAGQGAGGSRNAGLCTAWRRLDVCQCGLPSLSWAVQRLHMFSLLLLP